MPRLGVSFLPINHPGIGIRCVTQCQSNAVPVQRYHIMKPRAHPELLLHAPHDWMVLENLKHTSAGLATLMADPLLPKDIAPEAGLYDAFLCSLG